MTPGLPRDIESFEDWYGAVRPRLLAAVRLRAADDDVAADATSEAFSRALVRWERVRRMRSPEAWTYQVAVNLLRRGGARRWLEGALQRSVVEPAVVPAVPRPELWAAVRALPPRQRQAVILRYVLDLPESELTAVMGVSRGAVSATLFKARKRLAEALGPDYEEVRDG